MREIGTMARQRSVHDIDEVERVSFDWGEFRVTCSPELNAGSGLSAGVVVMLPGLGHERHNHPGAEEILHVISGNGEQMVEDDDGLPIVTPVQDGSTIYVPADRHHSTLNTGPGPLTMFVVYSPPGPEKAAREFPGARVFPPRRPIER